MISLKYNFLFVHLPKTGGNSVQEALAEYSEDRITSLRSREDGTERFDVVNDELGTTKHSGLPEYIRALGMKQVDDMLVFTIVRNPWDRLMSEFYYGMEFIVNLQPGKTVDEIELPEFDRERFLYEVSRAPRLEDLLFDDPPAGPINFIKDTPLDFVMHTETLQTDFDELTHKLDLPAKHLKHLNRTKRVAYKQNYDEELVEAVRLKYKNEIDYFGYEFEMLAPTRPGRYHLGQERTQDADE